MLSKAIASEKSLLEWEHQLANSVKETVWGSILKHPI